MAWGAGFQTVVVMAAASFVMVTSKLHPCTRPCREAGQPKVCRYRWLVENYLTLSRACYNCSNNRTECLRQECVAADGVQRGIRTINRQLPGPDIQVCEGDTIEVELTNQMVLSEGVTIHWHGIRQLHSPHMDGVAMLTQCPIPAFSTFTYRFRAEDPGTHMYHSHSGLYRGDGLFGSVVIRQPRSHDPHSDLYDLDLPEHVLVLNDWPHRPVVQVYTAFFHGHGSQAPDSILINGRGIYPPTREQLTSGPTTPLSEFHVQAGQRYRFRILNAGALRCPIEFSVDDHSLLLIATDGRPFKPFPVSSVLLFSGERYDFVLQAEGSESGVHWIRAKGLDICERNSVQQFAILKYHDHVTDHETKYPDDPMDYDVKSTSDGLRFNQWFLKDKGSEPDERAQIINMTSVEPDDDTLRKHPDQRIFLEFAYRLRNNVHFMNPDLYPARGEGYKTVSSTTINNISNILPPAPLLTQPEDVDPDLFCNASSMVDRDCSTEFCECVHRLEVREGDIVELVVYNSNHQTGYTHPLHLHGHSYRVVAVERLKERITYDRFLDLDKKGLIHRRLHRAPNKDTIPIPNGGFLILRIKADNPGAWFMHCHVSLHAEIGMAVTLQVTDSEGRMPAPPSDFPRCGTWPAAGHQPRLTGSGSDAKETQGDNSNGSRGNWVVPAVATLAVVNLVLVASSVFLYRRKKGRKSGHLYRRVEKPLSRHTEHVALSSEDENSTLLQS